MNEFSTLTYIGPIIVKRLQFISFNALSFSLNHVAVSKVSEHSQKLVHIAMDKCGIINIILYMINFTVVKMMTDILTKTFSSNIYV